MKYLARQPILDTEEQTAGYELLYRAAAEPFARISDIEIASRSVLEQILVLGCRELSGGNRLFINCSGEVLAREYISVFPPSDVVVEILESVEPTPAVIAACGQLKRSGFTIALDDFTPSEKTLPLLPFADIIKVDFRSTTELERADIVRAYCGKTIALAEKVETRAEYKSALQMGFKLFQGYFFCEPVLLVNRQLSPMKMNYLRLMEQTAHPEIDFLQVENIIKVDPALCFRMLRYLNSYAFCLRTPINSIRHALTLLGEHQVRRWIAVACVSAAADNSSPAQLSSALMRARLGELLAPRVGCKGYELFLLGLFSMMDTILGIPLEQLLTKIKVPLETQRALLGEHNQLRDILDLISAYDRGKWNKTHALCEKLNIEHEVLADDYIQAVQWVDLILGMSDEPAEGEAAPAMQAVGGNGLRPI
ncbi:MAG TPA: HDOD domain-containing protein [Candidatus Angelobacter sp.]|jgi:EAL and modified HD-GYP domain-containing signal transduction protein